MIRNMFNYSMMAGKQYAQESRLLNYISMQLVTNDAARIMIYPQSDTVKWFKIMSKYNKYISITIEQKSIDKFLVFKLRSLEDKNANKHST